MSHRCKGRCDTAKDINDKNSSSKVLGTHCHTPTNKYCSICYRFIEVKEGIIKCPCCNARMRTRPRQKLHKQKFFERFYHEMTEPIIAG